MPTIKLITSQRQQSTSGGTVFESNAPEEKLAGQIGNFANVIQGIEEKTSQKKASVATFEAENALMESSRLQLLDATENKNGKLALPDAEAGAKGVFLDYDEFAKKNIADATRDIDPRYQAQATAKLEGVANRYRDRFMAHQATQQGLHRKDVLYRNITATELELSTAMQYGGDLDMVDAAFGKIKTTVTDEAKGKPTSAMLDAKKNELYSSSIQATTQENPDDALAMLKDKRVLKVLTTDQRNELGDAAEKRRIEKTSETAVTQIQAQASSYDNQIILAREVLKDEPEALKKTLAELSYVDAKNKVVIKEQQDQLFQETYESIVDNENPPSPNDIDSDPQFELLETSQREYFKGLLTPGAEKSSPAKKANDFFLWTEAQGKIYSDQMTEIDVQDGVRQYLTTGGKQGIPPQFGKELFDDVAKAKKAPQIGSASAILLGENDFDSEDKAKFNEAFYSEINSATLRNGGKAPSYEETLAIGRKLAKPIHEDKWFQSPRFKDEKFNSLGAEEDAIMAPAVASDRGWNSAVYDEPSGFWYGRKGGKLFRYNPLTQKEQQYSGK